MAITTNIKVNGVDIGSFFGAKGGSTATATNIKINGTDLNQLLLARADGTDIGFNTGITVEGSDLRSIFGASQSSLPINGQSFSASAFSGTLASSASLLFASTSTGWSVTRTVSPNTGSGTLASGPNPSGATGVSFVVTLTSSQGTHNTSNSAPTNSPIGSSWSCGVSANGAPAVPEGQAIATITINYYNSGGTVISTTIINFSATATGAS